MKILEDVRFEAITKYKETLLDNINIIKDGDIIEIPLKEYLNRVNKIGVVAIIYIKFL